MNEFKIDEEYTLKKNPDTVYWDTYQYGKLLSKSTPKLFKFFSLNINNLDALFRNYFYLANPHDFNDPFDCNVNLIEDIGNLEEMTTVKRNNYKNIGICSFSEIIDSHLMWAHYTSNYNGWALEFTGNKIEMYKQENLLRHTLTRVIYRENPIKVKKDYPFAQNYVMTTKFKHWEYEKEWRIIAELLQMDRELFYSPKCVKAIYIGHKIFDSSPNIYKMIIEIHTLRFPAIPMFVVYPHSSDLKLEFERVIN